MPEQTYEIVISTDDGLDEAHARLMRKRLIQEGYHEESIELREVNDDA